MRFLIFYITFSFTFFFFFSVVLSQPIIRWQKCLGGNDDDYGWFGRQTPDGGYIIVGSTRSNDGDVRGYQGNQDGWIVKLSAEGDTLWTKCVGGSEEDQIAFIEPTQDGGYIAAGSTMSNDGDVWGNHGYRDSWIVKLDASGNILWTKCFGGTNYEYATAIKQTSDLGYIFCGMTFSHDGDVWGRKGDKDYWVVKLNAAGDTLWTRCYGGTEEDIAYDLKQTSDGGYIVSGSTFSNNGDVWDYKGALDCWVVRLNAGGDTLWTKCLGGSDTEYSPYSVLVTTDGYILAGHTQSEDNDVIAYNGGSGDCFVVKTNTAGTIQWAKCFGGNHYDRANSVFPTLGGNYIIGGVFNWGPFVMEISNTGNMLWSKSLGTEGNIRAAEPTPDKGYIVGGYTNENVPGYHGGKDFWVLKLCMPPLASFSCDTAICEGDTVNFTNISTKGAISFKWFVNANLIDTTKHTSHAFQQAGTYTVRLIAYTADQCPDTTEKLIIVYPLPHVTAIVSHEEICLGDSTTLFAAGAVEYAWLPNNYLNATTGAKVIATPQQEGYFTYEVTGTDSNQCSNTASFSITVHSLPFVDAGKDTGIVFGNNIMLNPSSAENYSWKPSEDLSCGDCPYPIAMPMESTTYFLTTQNKFNCIATDSVNITVDSVNALYVPNAFSPNGDGTNDLFYITGQGIKEVELIIYNYWGEKVFETKELGKEWDGTYKGMQLSSSIYVYQLFAIFNNKKQVYKKGHIIIIL